MQAKSANKNADRRKPRRRLRGWRAWTLRIALAVLSPVLFLLLVEGLLTLGGFGRPTGFFVTWRSADENVYLANREFCRQFVPRQLSRPPEKTILAASKDDSTVRIFVLGGSAAAGDPETAFGFCRILEALLNERSGQSRFVVVNAAITAMDSHVARRVARDCAKHAPDVFIVYMGNNEVVGPCGPTTLPESLYGSGGFIRTMIAVKGSKIGQLMGRLMNADAGPPKKWQGMEAFLEDQIPHGDARLEDCYRHFRANLQDIIKTARAARSKVVLCTVPTNIRSCAPFGSRHRGGLDARQLQRWQELFDQGRKFQQADMCAEAWEQFNAAAEIDDSYAALSYAVAKCADDLGRIEDARRHYRHALDLDTLRFRADSRINDIIRRQAETIDDPAAALLDLEEVLQSHAEGELLGADLLLDHVHLNFRANFLAAAAAARLLQRMLPNAGIDVPAPAAEKVDRDTEDLEERYRRGLLYDLRAEFDVAMLMYRRKTLPPFVGQLDHDAEMADRRSNIFRLRRLIKHSAGERLEHAYLAAVEQSPDDPILLRRLGELLVEHGATEEAIRRYRERLKTSPHCPTIRLALAEALAADDRAEEAVELLTAADVPYATDPIRALELMGTVSIKRGRKQQCEKMYGRVLEVDPENVDALVNLGAAALARDEPEIAEGYLQRALSRDPQCVDALGNLANSLVKRGKTEKACELFQRAVEVDPYHHTAHAGLGLQLVRQGDVPEGIEHVKRAVELNPDFPPGYQVLATLYRAGGAFDRAQYYRELAVLFGPD